MAVIDNLLTDDVSIDTSWNQEVIIVGNYDISLLQILFCKNAVNFKESVAGTAFYNGEKGHSSNGRLQLTLRLTQYFWKKEWLRVLLPKKLRQYPWKY